ncbi:MopE-related protein [Thermodesulfobacteriota bacterium]
MKRAGLFGITIAVVASMLCCQSALAAPCSVTTDYTTIQEALDAATLGLCDDDTVVVEDGTYYENIVWPDVDGITLKSLNGPAGCVIDGSGAGSVVTFNAPLTEATILMDLTITNGLGGWDYPQYWGGGITCGPDANPTIIGNIITGNDSDYGGGGIVCYWSAPLVTGNQISANTADIGGGGVYLTYATALVIGNEIFGNSAGNGGGVFLWKSGDTIMGNMIEENTANSNGGGIRSYDSSPTISDNDILSNVAGSGAGIDCYDTGIATIHGNRISENEAEITGGGIGVFYQAAPRIFNNVIDGNTANSGGGVGCLDFTEPVIGNNTIVGNTALLNGGGVATINSSPVIMNNIITDSVDGQGVYCDSSSAWIDFNNVWNNTDGSYQGCSVGGGEISADPQFADTDYHLDPASPCVDSGYNLAPELPDIDFEGDDRPGDGDGNGLRIVDLGADEIPDDCWDADGDWYTDVACAGTDCDDGNARVNPGMDELCDGLDSDCDGYTPPDEVDVDGDDYFACNDCDDANPGANPGAEEIKGNGIDDDCDGKIDEACFISTVM